MDDLKVNTSSKLANSGENMWRQKWSRHVFLWSWLHKTVSWRINLFSAFRWWFSCILFLLLFLHLDVLSICKIYMFYCGVHAGLRLWNNIRRCVDTLKNMTHQMNEVSCLVLCIFFFGFSSCQVIILRFMQEIYWQVPLMDEINELFLSWYYLKLQCS